eukprot:6472720-Lingulodinium_polyedra.AAC.1
MEQQEEVFAKHLLEKAYKITGFRVPGVPAIFSCNEDTCVELAQAGRLDYSRPFIITPCKAMEATMRDA